MRKKRIKKRTRLIALLSALATLAVGGIGTGLAFSAMAATNGQSSAASERTTYKALPRKVRVIKGSSDSQNSVLASTDKLAFCKNNSHYSLCTTAGVTGAFNSSAQVNYWVESPQIHGGWAGNTFQATVTLGDGLYMPIADPIGLWNGSSFVNPNSLTPEEIDQYMLNGGYMGNISVLNNYNGAWYAFLGGVNYNGTVNQLLSTYVSKYSGIISGDMMGTGYTLQPESIQYIFQDACNKSEILDNPYFAKMAAETTSQLTSTLNDLIFGSEGLYTTDEEFYGQGEPASSPVGEELSDLKSEGQNLDSSSTVEEYQKAFEAYAEAIKAGKSASDARTAYLDAINGTDAAKDQPLLCLAAWDQNVGYTSFPSVESLYTQGTANSSNVSDALNSDGNALNVPSSYSYWGAGPSYEGTSDAGKSTLGLNVSSVATSFLENVLGSQSNGNGAKEGIFVTAFFNPGQNSSFYSENGSGVTLNISPSQYGGALGVGHYIAFHSLGTSATNVNPTSLPVTLSTSSPASDGLYFKAVSQSGEPLKSVEMELTSSSGNSWTGWNDEPIAPATNSAPSGVSKEIKEIWSNSGNSYWAGYSVNVPFTANSITSQPGWFDFSGLAPAVYQVKILSGTTESGKTVSYGSYYTAPTFEINASSYTSPETITASSDPCGFVDPSQDEVVVGASNPSSAEVTGSSLSTSAFTATVGSSNPYTYQTQAYLPFDLSGEKNTSGTASSSTPLSFSLSVPGQSVVSGSVKVNGLALSSLSGSSSSVSASTLTLSLTPQDISTIESKGDLPIGSSSGSLTQNGETNRTLAVTWQAYLTPSFTSSSSSTFEFDYKAYSSANSGDKEMALTPEVETNGPAGQDYSKVSLDPASSPSSETGLWFKDLQADGSASTGAKFLIQNSSGQYLEEDTSSGAFSGWSWTSSPSSALEFSQRNADAVFSFGGLQNGTYTVTEVSWPDSIGKSGRQYTGEQNWPSITPGVEAGGTNNDWAGYPGHFGGKAGYDGSFQVTLSYSSPEAMSTQADPAGLVDSSKDSIYAFAPVKMAPLVNSSLSTQAYQTETVGSPFTEGWEGYLPMAVTSPTSTSGQNGYASELTVSFPEKGSGLNSNGNSSGLEMSNPSTSNIEVAGVPLSTLVSNGASVSPSNSDYSISLPYKALEYLEENGKNASGDSLSSSSNRLIIISFPAVMGTSFKNGGQFQQWMALGSGWWNQNAGSGWGVYSSPLYTNGPADNSVPSSLSPSQNSSNTGIWFKSLWYGTSTPAPGSKYTVQNSSGKYLTPVETSGTFEGWSWSTSPYDFSEQNSSAVFSFGGLSDGAYTLTQVDPATGATASTLSFTSTLSYTSPESLKAVKDSLNLLDSSKDTVWAMVVPSSLPFTGGKMILLVSLSAVVLFGAGAIFFILRKRRRA